MNWQCRLRPLLLLSLFVAFFAGCESANNQFVVTDGQGNLRTITSNSFKLQDNVHFLNLNSGVEVANIDGDSITFTGNVPGISVGDVIIRGEGVSQFTRRVTSVAQQGGNTVVQTERIGLTDIFKEANITEQIDFGPEFLGKLQPAMPGVEFGEPQRVLAQGTELQAWRLPITFKEAVVAENGRGSVLVNGEVGLRVGLRTDLQIGTTNFVIPTLNRFELVPVVTIDGNLKVTGSGSGEFRKELPITGPISYPLAGFAGIGLNLQGTLNVVVDGYVQSNGEFSVKNASVKMEGGVRYQNGNWSVVQSVTPTFEITPPQLRADANLTVSILQPKVSLNLCDMGEIFLNAQIIKLETEARLVANPSPAYDVRVYRTFGVELGARLALGVSPLSIKYDGYFPLISGDRTEVAHLGVSLPAAESSDLFTILFFTDGKTGPMKVGEQRIMVGLTYFQAGLLVLPIPRPYTWTSSDPSRVQLTSYEYFAIARALKPGKAAIKATPRSNRVGYLDVSVSSEGITGIEILPGLTIGRVSNQGKIAAQQLSGNQVPEFGSRELQAVGVYSNGAKVDLTYAVNWSSLDVNGKTYRNGQLDGRLAGQTGIRVVDPVSGRSAQANFQVVRVPIESMVIFPFSPAKLELTTGQTTQLRVGALFADASVREVTKFISWSSSNPAIASVQDGLVTAKLPGEVVIKAYDSNGYAMDSKRIVINKAPLTSLRIEPATGGPFLVGHTQQFRAIAGYADGTSGTVSTGVVWRTNNDNAARVSSDGVVTVVGQGTFKVKALLNGKSAATDNFEVTGPAGLLFHTQPSDVEVGHTFDVYVEVRDSKNQLWTDPVQVTLELGSGPANSQLGGSLTQSTSGGYAAFTGLSVNQVGSGYTLQALASGLSIATSDSFDGLAAGAGTLGHLFFNTSLSTNGVGALNMAAVAADGTFSAVPNGPYDTAGSAYSLTKVGNFVVVAIGDGANKNSLQSFAYDSGSGTLTAAGLSGALSLGPTSPTLLKLDSGGGDVVVCLNAFDDKVQAWRVGPNGGLTLLDTAALSGSLFQNIEYYDAPGSTDYVYVSGSSANRIAALSFDTVNGTFGTVPNSPFTYPFTRPGAMETQGDNLFVLSPEANVGDDAFSWYKIDQATGKITNTGLSFGTGDGPVGIHAVGDYLYIGNQNSADISAYKIGTSFLTALNGGTRYPAGEINPHSFADVVLSANETALYVATSNRVAAYIIDTATGLLTALSGSPFGPYDSPEDIRR